MQISNKYKGKVATPIDLTNVGEIWYNIGWNTSIRISFCVSYGKDIMTDKEIKQIKDFLNGRECDKVYQKYSNISIHWYLESKVKDELNSKQWRNEFNIGYYKDYYYKGITLSQFINNILKKVGVAHYKQTLNRLVGLIKHKTKDRYSESEIKEAIYYRMFYMNYKGFLFEDLAIEFFQSEGFDVIETKELDNDYKIDLLLKHKDYEGAIGIQCKNESYTNVSMKIKNDHKAYHLKAILNGICKDVIFVLYGRDFNIFYNYGLAINEERLVGIIKNKLENGNKKILNVGRQ